MPTDPRVAAVIAAAAQGSGLDQRYPGFMERMAQIESSGNPDASNASGAAGLYQFMPKTAQAYGLADPYDPDASAKAAARLTLDNEGTLKRSLGRDPTQGELYLAHQQGAGGASMLLANPDAPAAELVGAKAVTSNGGTAGMTARDFAGLWLNKFDGGGRAMTMPGGGVSRGAFGLSGPVAAGMPGSITPSGGAAMQAPEADRGLQVAALLRTLTAADAPAASPVAQAAAAAPAMPQAQPLRRPAGSGFDASRFFALLPGAAAR
ncbi:hypothetical protein ADL19_13430 [Streptomyces purpurogeneiscleroticus]|nr:hypothetical protein ADL19_13430 [Streptomyces purpurogeneiscleroticus]